MGSFQGIKEVSREFTPRAYQNALTDFIIQNQRVACHVDMGLGKSVSTLNALDTLKLLGDDSKVLIVAPLRVARDTWRNELLKWSHLQHYTISAIVGDRKQREIALRTHADFYTINYENLKWLAEELGTGWPFRTVVFDESTKLKSHRSHFRAKSDGTKYLVCTGGTRIAAIAKQLFTKTRRVILLTGTPAPNGLKDLWPQHFFVDKGEALGSSFSAFEDRWYKIGYNGYDKELLPYAEVEIRKAIAPTTFTLRAEDYLDLGEEIVNTVFVDMPEKGQKHYREMEKKLYTIIEAGEVEAYTAAAKSQKCHQIANGAIYWDDKGSYEEIHDAKIEALQSIIEEAAGMPVIVVYKFKSDLARLKKAFPSGKALDTKKKTEDDFRAGLVPILFLHPDSAGHGIDGFQNVTNILCFFSVDWNGETRSQVIARIGKVRQFQAGLDRPVFIHQIICRNTVDEDILRRIDEKLSIEDALKAGLARRNLK
jgi:SNF2 family DNA or RNA helicase